MRKQKTLVMGVLASAIVFVGGLVMSPNAEAKEKSSSIKAFPRIELVDNDINEYDGSVTVVQGSQRYIQWEAVGVKEATIGINDGKAKFNTTSPLTDECQLMDGGSKQPCLKLKEGAGIWAQLRSSTNLVQYAVYAAPNTTIPDRVLHSQTMTFRHLTTFDQVGEVKIIFRSTKVNGSPETPRTLTVHVVPGGGYSFASFEMNSLSRQNLWSPNSDEGTSTDNGIGIGFNIIGNDQIVVAANFKTRAGFAAINDTNLLMSGGQNLVTAFTVSPDIYSRDGMWRVAPSIAMMVEPATGTVLNPGVMVGLKAFKKFNWFTNITLRTEFGTNFVESCNSGGYGELGLNLLGLHSPWDLELLLGAMMQGKLLQPETVTTSPYIGLGTGVRILGGNAELAVVTDLYTGGMLRFGFRTGIPDFWKQ